VRLHNKNAKILIYRDCKETVTGLVIPPEPVEIEVGEMEITFDMAFGDKAIEKLNGLKDASGTFTGYYDK
jgi:hypothetical protein